jgi:flagellar biosynthesis GTPase FlhF
MDAITDVKFDKDAINDLILEPEENKGLLKALTKRYAQKPNDIHLLPPTIQNGVTVVQEAPDSWDESVKEKGEGQIILLHGPPGVGKTCTAGKTSMFWFHSN